LSPPRTRELPYGRLAEVYDRVYAWKDYAGESRRIRALVRTYGPRRARTLLDVACGTGGHLRYLSRRFECTGLDTSPAMLRVARRRLPHVRFVRGRMESLQLPARFDVITCLFSAIGYVRSERDLRRTLRGFARHLNPGGVVIVEPWFAPGAYRPGRFHLGTYGTKASPIARMNRSDRRGNRSILDMHYLVAGPRGVAHWVERHDLGLFPVATSLAAYRAAGLRARYLRDGFLRGRGLFVAVRPATRVAAREPATRGSSSRRPRRGS
jgi:ubiquinone/menaquinone biosynthesis C-methylase UbiE